MRKMKDSGIAWIGEIPTNWTTIKFSSFIERMGTGLNPRDNFVLDKESPFYYVTIRNFKNGKLYLDDNCDRISQEAFNIIQERSQLQAGDFLFASISKEPQVFLLNETPCNWNINESVFCIRPKKGIYLTNYLYYLLTDYRFYESLLTDATGSTFLSIKQNKLKQSTLVLPPNDEQQKIASHLDSKCTQIDSLIANVQQQIEKLKAYKQSLITETVTKGLNPDAPMKDSGIEWIGEIPEHWEITKYGRICKVKSNLVHPESYPDYIQIAPDNIEKGSGKLLPCQTVKEAGVISDNHLFYKGQIIYSKIRPILNKVTIAPFDGLCSADMYPIETTQNYRYVLYYMLSDLFLIQVKMVTENRVKMPKINQEEISQIITVFPPIEEQNEIVSFLDEKCSQIDTLIALKQQKIEKLQQYKKSLIYEYVTGKREV